MVLLHNCVKGWRRLMNPSDAFDAVPPPRVILAEDDREMRTMLAESLRRDGYQVIEAADGRALDALIRSSFYATPQGEPVDLIVTDVRMPGCSGLSVLEAVREARWAIPVILITAYGDEATHEAARRLGVTAIFDKPFDVDDLRTAVLNAVPPAWT